MLHADTERPDLRKQTAAPSLTTTDESRLACWIRPGGLTANGIAPGGRRRRRSAGRCGGSWQSTESRCVYLTNLFVYLTNLTPSPYPYKWRMAAPYLSTYLDGEAFCPCYAGHVILVSTTGVELVAMGEYSLTDSGALC
eukprot:474627-Pyramimonas_sp.AAC.1